MSSGSMTLQTGIGWILRLGVVVSLVLETAGILLSYLQGGDAFLGLSPSWLAGGGNFFGFASATISSVSGGFSAVNLTALGVVVLMLTPYVRVLAAVVYYFLEKDWKFVGITFLVLSVITAGLLVL